MNYQMITVKLKKILAKNVICLKIYSRLMWIITVQERWVDKMPLMFFDKLKLFKTWGSKRILIVDDEEFCISTMRAIFESAGFNSDY